MAALSEAEQRRILAFVDALNAMPDNGLPGALKRIEASLKAPNVAGNGQKLSGTFTITPGQ